MQEILRRCKSSAEIKSSLHRILVEHMMRKTAALEKVQQQHDEDIAFLSLLTKEEGNIVPGMPTLYQARKTHLKNVCFLPKSKLFKLLVEAIYHLVMVVAVSLLKKMHLNLRQKLLDSLLRD